MLVPCQRGTKSIVIEWLADCFDNKDEMELYNGCLGNDRVPNIDIVEQKTVWTTGRHYFSKNSRSYTHLAVHCLPWYDSCQELNRKSIRKGKMRNRGKDPSYHKKWAEIGKYVVKVAYFDTFSTNIAP